MSNTIRSDRDTGANPQQVRQFNDARFARLLRIGVPTTGCCLSATRYRSRVWVATFRRWAGGWEVPVCHGRLRARELLTRAPSRQDEGEASPRQVVIVEAGWSGHRLYYVRLLAEAALARGDSVCLAVPPQARQTPEYAIHLSALLPKINIRPHQDFSISGIARLSISMGALITVVPDGDLFALRLGLRGTWRGSGGLTVLVLREPTQHLVSLVRGLKALLKELLLRRADGIDGVRVVGLRSSTWKGTSVRSIARDPVTLSAGPSDVTRLRRALGLSPEIYWFGVAGRLSARKNISLVAGALVDCPASNVGLVLAGSADGPTRTECGAAELLLRAAGVPVVIVDRSLTSVELDAFVILLDCLVLAHTNEGPSGLLGKALAAGTRVVAAGAESLKRDVHRFPDSTSWSPLSTRDLRAAFGAAARQERPATNGLVQETRAFTDALL